MSACRLLLVPSFTELEWGIRPLLEEWADVGSFDTPGVGVEPVPPGLVPGETRPAELLARWREAAAERGTRELERRGWKDVVVVADGHGAPTAVRLAQRRRDSILGLAVGHASLSHGSEGERAPMRRGIWEAMTQLARQGRDTFVRYGIAQMTRGAVTEQTAGQMLERFHDVELVSTIVDALGKEPEPIGDDLAALSIPLLVAKHEGCLGWSDEGFEDIVATFPHADTVVCPEACTASPAFAHALQAFCERVARG